MKTLNLILIILMLPLCYCSQKRDESDLNRENIRGQVNTLTMSVYFATEKNGEPQKDSLRYKETSKYNDQGNLLEEKYIGSNGNILNKQICKYDSIGNRLEMDMYRSVSRDSSVNRITQKFTYKNDAKGRQIERNSYGSGSSLTDKFTYKYDTKGNLVESYNFSLKNTYKYDKYDKTGNWLRQIVFVDDKLSTINEREIVYY